MLRAGWMTWSMAALLLACAPSAPPASVASLANGAASGAGVVFAEVGGVAITAGQLTAFEDLDASAAGAGTLRYPQLLGKVEDRVRFELLAQAAAAKGLAQDPEVVEAARKTMVRKLLAAEFAADKIGSDVTEDALRDYYARHEADFLRPEARRFALLRFANDAWGRAQAEAFARNWRAEADDARGLAAALRVADPLLSPRAARRRRRPRNQPHWQAEAFSSRADVVRRHGDEVAEAVFAGPPLSFPVAVVQTQRGAVAVRVLACRRGLIRSYAEARPEILEQLVRRRRTEHFATYLDGLREARPLTIYEDRMKAWLARPNTPPEAVRVSAPAPAEPASLGGSAPTGVSPTSIAPSVTAACAASVGSCATDEDVEVRATHGLEGASDDAAVDGHHVNPHGPAGIAP